MGSAVIGLTSYRCGVDGAHGGASEEETWLYRLLHTRHQRRLSRRSVGQRFDYAILFLAPILLCPYPIYCFYSRLENLIFRSCDLPLPRVPEDPSIRVRIIHRILALKREWKFPGWAPSSENSAKSYAGAFPS